MNCTTKTAKMEINPIVAELLTETIKASTSWDRFGIMENTFKRGGLIIDMETSGALKFVLSGCACLVDSSADLEDENNIDALFRYVDRGGRFPFTV